MCSHCRMASFTAWAKEWGTCLLLQFHPMPVSREQFAIMRASFMLTHHVPESFNFMDYITTVRPAWNHDFCSFLFFFESWLESRACLLQCLIFQLSPVPRWAFVQDLWSST